MRMSDKLKKIIDSAKMIPLMYVSGYTTGTRDWYECPCCGGNVPYDDKYTMKDVEHDSTCLYNLVLNLENTLSEEWSLENDICEDWNINQLLNNIKVEDERN